MQRKRMRRRRRRRRQGFQENPMKKTLKSSILIGFSIINHPFWGPTPIFGSPHVLKFILQISWSFLRPCPGRYCPVGALAYSQPLGGQAGITQWVTQTGHPLLRPIGWLAQPFDLKVQVIFLRNLAANAWWNMFWMGGPAEKHEKEMLLPQLWF